MTRELLASLYEYGIWANERLFDQAAKLEEADRRRRWSQGAQSIHDTFVHLTGADWRWFCRWRGEPIPPTETFTRLPTLDAVRAKWRELLEPRKAYLTGLSDAELTAPLTLTFERTFTLPRWQAILHCANHGTQHRSEIAAMLTDAGHSPGDLDYLFFCRPK
jgi:uncharacterized damage-inducible protein DinB